MGRNNKSLVKSSVVPVTKSRRITYRDKLEQNRVLEDLTMQERPITSAAKGFHIQAKNKNQQLLIDGIENFEITIAVGPAGTGKTFVSMMTAAKLFSMGKYKSIVMTRSIIPTGRSMGFLPGDVTEKMIPWLLPMISVLESAFGKSKYEYLYAREQISIQPLETIRGRSFEDTIILIDEAQNLDFEEIKAITTRIGEGSKMVLMGDTFQSDIKGHSALLKFIDMCYRHGIDVPVVEFGIDDIVRSDIVAKLVRMYMNEAGYSKQDNRDNSGVTPARKPKERRTEEYRVTD